MSFIAVQCPHWVAYLALTDNVPGPPSSCPNGMNQLVISPQIRFFGPLATLGTDRKHTNLLLPHERHSPPTLYTA